MEGILYFVKLLRGRQCSVSLPYTSVIVKHPDHIHTLLYPNLFYVSFRQHITCQVFLLTHNLCLAIQVMSVERMLTAAL